MSHEPNLRKWVLLRDRRLYWRWPWERPVSADAVSYFEELERRKEAAGRMSCTCCCCADEFAARDENDPWEGRMDAYCDECSWARCDAFPGECPTA